MKCKEFFSYDLIVLTYPMEAIMASIISNFSGGQPTRVVRKVSESHNVYTSLFVSHDCSTPFVKSAEI